VANYERFTFGEGGYLTNRMRIRAKFFLGQDEFYKNPHIDMGGGSVKVEEFGLVQLVVGSNRSALVNFADQIG
jgi:hypothetical protein